MEELLIWQDVIDNPDPKDRLLDEFLEFADGIEEAKFVWPREYIPVPDQGNAWICSYVWLINIINWYNIIEDINNTWQIVRDRIDPIIKDDWVRHLTTRLSNAKKVGLIEWYLLIPRVWVNGMTKDQRNEKIKKALQKYFIYTGVENVNWSKWWTDPIINFNTSLKNWHCMWLVSCDNTYHTTSNLYEFINHFSDKFWDKWYSYLKEIDIDKMMSAYIIIDKNDSGIFKLFKLKKKLEELIKAWKDSYVLATELDRKDIVELFNKLWISKALQPIIDNIK